MFQTTIFLKRRRALVWPRCRLSVCRRRQRRRSSVTTSSRSSQVRKVVRLLPSSSATPGSTLTKMQSSARASSTPTNSTQSGVKVRLVYTHKKLYSMRFNALFDRMRKHPFKLLNFDLLSLFTVEIAWLLPNISSNDLSRLIVRHSNLHELIFAIDHTPSFDHV